MDDILNRLDAWMIAVPLALKLIPGIISVASVVAAATPTKTDDEVVGIVGRIYVRVRKVVGFFALNFLIARPHSKSAVAVVGAIKEQEAVAAPVPAVELIPTAVVVPATAVVVPAAAATPRRTGPGRRVR